MNIHTILAGLITGGLFTAFIKSRIDLHLLKTTKNLSKTQKFIHKHETRILFVVAGFVSVILFMNMYNQMGFSIWFIFGFHLVNIAVMSLSYWILFDPLMAVGIGEKWNYLGETSFIDSFKIPIHLKILSLTMVICFYYALNDISIGELILSLFKY